MKHLLLLLVLAGCVDRGAGPQGKKIEPGYVRENLLASVPQDIQPLNVELGPGGKVIYLGNKIIHRDGKDPATPLAPGGAIRVMHYWQVKEPPGAQWKVFTLVRGAPHSVDFMNLGPTDMQIGHPTKKWKAGQIIQDVQDIVLRPDWRSPMATIHVGLVEDGGNQIGDRMAASGPNVVDRAIIARTIEVDLSKAPPPPGTVYVPRASGPITIDGVASDPGWASAVTSPQLVTALPAAGDSPDPVGRTTARMTWDDEHLYVFVQIMDTDVYSPYKQKDEPLWKADCVELFIDADGNRAGYVELQVNPNNAQFDSFFAGTRAQPGDVAWDSGMTSAVTVRGTPDKPGDADQGWDVEIAIPLAAVKGTNDAMNVRLPPQVGDRWRVNVVRVDYRSGSAKPAVASWNQITNADFHALDRMLTVVFADTGGSIVPAPPGSEAAPAEGTAAPPVPPAQPAQPPGLPGVKPIGPSIQMAPTGAPAAPPAQEPAQSSAAGSAAGTK